MQKLAFDVTFKQMTAKESINIHGNILVATMYREYTELKYMHVIGELDPNSLTRSHNKIALVEVNPIIEEQAKTKREDMRIGATPDMIHHQRRCILSEYFS